MPVETTTPIEIRTKGIELARIAFSYYGAEQNAIGELLSFATRNNVNSYEVQDWLEQAGYPLQQARNYASKLRAVKRDPEVRERVAREEVSFDKGVKEARRNKRESDQGWEIMLNALATFVRLAIKFQMNLEWMKLTLEREHAKQTKN